MTRCGHRLGCVLMVLLATAPAFAATRHLVLLYDERTALPAQALFDASIDAFLTANSPEPLELYREQMDRSRFDRPGDFTNLRGYLTRKYADRTVDAVVTVMGPALDFALNYGEQIFSGAPVVFAGIDRRELAAGPLPDHVTGVFLKREFAPTLDLALALHPQTETVVFVGGASEFDRRLIDQARSELAPYESLFAFRYLTDLPLPELLGEVSQLPPDTVVLTSSVLRDSAGDAFVPHDVVDRIAAAANAPVYGFFDEFLGRGIVGGHLYTMDSHAEEVGRLVLNVLSGISPAMLPPVERGDGQVVLDGRQLERWNIDERALPPDSIVRFRNPSLWSTYASYLLAAGAIVAMQAIAIGGLLVQRARSRRLEAELRASGTLFRTMADTAPVMIWTAGADETFEFLNKRWLEFTGETPAAAAGRSWAHYVHPDDSERWRALREHSRAGLSIECRMRRRDGVYRWMLCGAVARFAPGGELLGYVGSCVDIDALRNAELENRRQLSELAHVSRVATLGQLTASMAHELNQPLTAIMANCQAAEQLLELAAAESSEVREIIVDVHSSARRAADIIRRMRSLLQKHEIARTTVVVDEAVREVIKLLHSEALARRVALNLTANAGDARVSGDHVHLQQVVMNLVLNAFEAVRSSDEGNRRIEVRTEVKLSGAVDISIVDSGPGIPPEALPRLFEPFYTTKTNGLGMGLAIARSIIVAHGGSVVAESGGNGRGACFRVTLPPLGADSVSIMGAEGGPRKGSMRARRTDAALPAGP